MKKLTMLLAFAAFLYSTQESQAQLFRRNNTINAGNVQVQERGGLLRRSTTVTVNGNGANAFTQGGGRTVVESRSGPFGLFRRTRVTQDNAAQNFVVANRQQNFAVVNHHQAVQAVKVQRVVVAQHHHANFAVQQNVVVPHYVQAQVAQQVHYAQPQQFIVAQPVVAQHGYVQQNIVAQPVIAATPSFIVTPQPTHVSNCGGY